MRRGRNINRHFPQASRDKEIRIVGSKVKGMGCFIHRFSGAKDMLTGGKPRKFAVFGASPFTRTNDNGALMHLSRPYLIIFGYVDHPSVVLSGRCADNLILVQHQIRFAL